MLTQLQADIEANRPPTAATADRSVQIHVAHGARRQVEITRDAILHALKADPTLQPRDIAIMTPDLATFAPLLEAAFPTDSDDLPDLRLRIADRSPAAVNPLVRFAATVLDLADSRLEAERIRELVTRPVVQQRFGFDLDTAGQSPRSSTTATSAGASTASIVRHGRPARATSAPGAVASTGHSPASSTATTRCASWRATPRWPASRAGRPPRLVCSPPSWTGLLPSGRR